MRIGCLVLGFGVALCACGNDGGSAQTPGTGGSGGSAGSAGASGTPAAGGSSGSGGASGGGTGGVVDPGAHCETAGPAPTPANCSLNGYEQELPNPTDLFVDSLALATPLVAGESYAISFSASNTGIEANIEIWGTDSECGVVSELLWYGPVTNTISCGQFTPSAAHSHAVVAIRPLRDSSNFFIGSQNFQICPAGSCPAGADGMGLAPGGSLQAPTGAYEWSYGGWYGGREGPIGGKGYMMAVHGGTLDVVTPLAQGVFRMPESDPYGDAWYCFGPGSTATELNENELELSLTGITRLGTCAEQTGTGTASIVTMGTSSVITTAVPLLPAGADINTSGTCRGEWLSCDYTYNQVPIFSWMRATVDTDIGQFFTPMPDIAANVLESEWVVYQDVDGQPLGVVCGAGGTAVNGGQDGTVEFQLEGMADLLGCPGTPIDGATLTLITY